MGNAQRHIMSVRRPLSSRLERPADTLVTIDAATGQRETTQQKETWVVESLDDVVTVEAGTFKDCLRIHRTNEELNRKSTYWFAPGIGKVKEDTPPKELEELIACSVK